MTSLSTLDRPLKIFISTYILIVSVGFFIGLAFIKTTSDLKPSTIVEHYNGSDPNNENAVELKFEKSVKDLLMTTHNHLLGLSSIFFITGLLFYYTTAVKPAFKFFLMIEPFLSLLLTFGGIWIVRFLWEPFVFLVILSGILMFISFGLMNILIFRELWFVKEKNS